MESKSSTAKDKASLTSASELAQLRDIVFGSAQRQLNDKVDTLREDVERKINELKKQNEQSVVTLQQAISKTETNVLTQLTNSNHLQDEQSHKLEEALNTAKTQLSSEIEMTDTSGKEDVDAIHNRIDKEIRQLTHLLNEYKTQSLDKLSDVNNELNSSKTDRKKLAKLLATMATNLEADEYTDE